MSRKTVIITGGNRGIGFAAAKKLISTKEWNVILACRSLDKGNQAVGTLGPDSTNATVDFIDLADLESVKSFAERWGKKPIHCLVLNAGIHTGTTKQAIRTAQGFETTVGTNHIGHFYLLKKLLPQVESVDGRIVFVGSAVHNPDGAGGKSGPRATLGEMEGLEKGFTDPVSMVDGGAFDPDKAYKDSKLCNVMTSLELARQLKLNNSKTTCNVMSPGFVPTTGLFREFNPFFVWIFSFLGFYLLRITSTEEVAGERLFYMVNSRDLDEKSGLYYYGKPQQIEIDPTNPSVEAQDEEKRKKLWELTDKIIEKAGF